MLGVARATGRSVMKVSDVIRELERESELSPKTIHILANMMADVAWCKQGIKQQFECYAELIAIVKGLNAFLSLNSDALEHLQERVKKDREKKDNIASEPGELEESVSPYGQDLKG
jgi:predicted transcriptional regulator